MCNICLIEITSEIFLKKLKNDVILHVKKIFFFLFSIKKLCHFLCSQIPPTKPNNNPFFFWFYFTLFVSFLTLFLVFTSSTLSPQYSKTWFLTLPSPSTTITPTTVPSRSKHTSTKPPSKSLTAKGLHITSLDLPGHGFSDNSVEVFVGC